MKKISLIALALVTMLSACKKENLTMAPEEKNANHQNVNAQIQKIQDNIQNTNSLGSFQEMSRATSTEINRKECQPIPTGVGQGVVVTEILAETVKIDYYLFYRFYVSGQLINSAMQLKVSWMDVRKLHTATYSFMVTATANYDELGLAIISNIEVPKDKLVTFTVTGKNNCGQKSKYEATFMYSSATTRNGSINETIDLLKKIAVFTTCKQHSIISENIE